MKARNIVDSSAWLEYLQGTPHAKHLKKPVEDMKNLLVPSIIICEVCKYILRKKGKREALSVVAHMKEGTVVDLDMDIALLAAKESVERKMPMADSIIYATAKLHGATIWTMDADFRNFENVRYFPRKKGVGAGGNN